MNNCEEEKLILISQVKAYSRQCEELKKMLQLQEKSKCLEEQLYHKEQIESEVINDIKTVVCYFLKNRLSFKLYIMIIYNYI